MNLTTFHLKSCQGSTLTFAGVRARAVHMGASSSRGRIHLFSPCCFYSMVSPIIIFFRTPSLPLCAFCYRSLGPPQPAPRASSARDNPMDFSLEFLFSEEGRFVRAAYISDLRRAALSLLRSGILRRGFCQRRETSAGTAHSPVEGETQQQNPTLPVNGGEAERGVMLTAAREASRRALQRRVLTEVRRKPVLAARAAAAVISTAGMVRESFEGPLPHRRYEGKQVHVISSPPRVFYGATVNYALGNAAARGNISGLEQGAKCTLQSWSGNLEKLRLLGKDHKSPPRLPDIFLCTVCRFFFIWSTRTTGLTQGVPKSASNTSSPAELLEPRETTELMSVLPLCRKHLREVVR